MSKKILYILTACIFILTAFSGCVDGDVPPAGEPTIAEAVDEISKANITVNTKTTTNYQSISDMVADIKDSVVEIECVVSNGTSAGSGVLFGISQDKYYVLTNHHIVDDAYIIFVRLTDGRRFSASYLASDANTDIAVLTISNENIDQTKFKTVTIPSDEYKLRVGDTAIVIGNPLGSFGGSVTQGIISALDREVEIDGIKMNVLQTDAASNPGNSGGGIFDAYGQLVGITNAGVSVEGIEGISFAIPVKTVVTAACELIQNGKVTGKPSIGIRALNFATMDEMEEFYAGLGLTQRQEWYAYFEATEYAMGIYVYSLDNSNCELMVGDYIKAFNGTAITAGEGLSELIAECNIGQTVTITVLRNGQEMDVDVVLIESREV